MKFTKMQATGNDFVMIDARSVEMDWPGLARAMCHRRFGVGADGIILILNSEKADFRMRIFNPDGSEAETCGNGLRCFTRYAIEKGITGKKKIEIETLAGIARAEVRNSLVRIAMGVPQFEPSRIPVDIKGQSVPVLDYPIKVGEKVIPVSLVSMGNPHAVAFLKEPVADFSLHEIGPQVEHHAMFPRRTNFEIVNAVDRGHLKVRIWERGAGETLSCGSGACAVAVAARLKGLAGDAVEIQVPGGTLVLEWDGKGEVFLTGPAERVFEGEWPNH
ncbi:MAG: diaminopimelate epimerase [Chloroflexi bacterium]|nr:diaminopimelate epimerase [Chloroflexota bacterium]